MDHLADLKYMDAVIKESLRHYHENLYFQEFTLDVICRPKIIPNQNAFFKLTDMLKANVAQRKLERQNNEDESKSKDFIDIFLDAKVDVSEVKFGEESDTARKLSTDEIVSQCLIFLLAGFDTTSNSLAYVTHFLANHSEVQQKLIDEIDSFVADHESFEIEVLKNLKYTDAVIKESLRHYPLGSIAHTRECTRTCEIGGFRFEAGDMVQVDTWSMHMDKDVWGEDAEEFRPERWLEPSDRPRTAFQSFGEGPRICLGMRLAYIEEKVALLKLMSRFRIQKTTKTNPIKLVGSLTVSPAAVTVKLVKR
ncbi:hypothetical protein PRIPAC_81930 [Pristionchus pacificus]|uniref:Cytochrome P450 n=1 Tax=Pristionchus pacificus TaxID=54126 RepID=A0A2A6CK40_PRIPA|nr:hypothetical protein PRIPAC_81930 [Pristionchus pacificus]|eukprot:PDM78447.1 cytochrome P450 [Pristionchus pacificus]